MPTFHVPYEENARQKLFHSCPAEEVVYGGAKGGGKTAALVVEAMAYAFEHPGARVYLFRESYDDLEDNLIKEWKERAPKELYEYSETKHKATLLNGSTVFFRYIADQSDADKYQGRSMDFIGVDELTKHTKEAIQVLLSCLRSPKGFPPRFRGSCNPGDIGHQWVKERYILPTNYGQKTITDPETGNRIAFIPAKVYDNVVLMENDPGYVRRLQNLPLAKRKAFLDGDWDSFEGQYFDEWNHAVHVIEPFEIPEWWLRFRSLDYGLDMTACQWWAVDGEGTCYITRELHQPGLSLTKAAKKIVELTPEEERGLIRYTVASPDLWNKRQESDTGKSGVEYMLEGGLSGLIKADNRRIPGWRSLKEYLAPYEITNEEGEQVLVAKLHIFDHCLNLIRCLPALVHDPNNPEDVADKNHELSHQPEALRYGIMSRPPRAIDSDERQRRRWARQDAQRPRFGKSGV